MRVKINREDGTVDILGIDNRGIWPGKRVVCFDGKKRETIIIMNINKSEDLRFFHEVIEGGCAGGPCEQNFEFPEKEDYKGHPKFLG